MPVSDYKKRLETAKKADGCTVDFDEPLSERKLTAVHAAPKPDIGKVTWTLPPSYQAFLRAAGTFSVAWQDEDEFIKELALLDASAMRSAGETVYMPKGVDFGDGRPISTNHLVPFASTPGGDGEWSFCFDVSAPGPEYPIYYHHQDGPRAKYEKTDEWAPGEPKEPDFENFEAWLIWVTALVEKQVAPDGIGLPTGPALKFIRETR